MRLPLSKRPGRRLKTNRRDTMKNTLRLFRPLSLVACLTLFAATIGVANAETDFDGTWSVQIVSEDGTCPARTVAIQVQESRVHYAGFGATAEGAINDDGALRASFRHRNNIVKAKGALKGELGYGSWSSERCGGSWTARRG